MGPAALLTPGTLAEPTRRSDMMKIHAAIIAATIVLGCGGIAEGGGVVDDSEMRLVLANPGPSLADGCFRAVAGHDSCVRLPGDSACEPLVAVNHGDSYEVWTDADAWGAPTLTGCDPGEVLQ